MTHSVTYSRTFLPWCKTIGVFGIGGQGDGSISVQKVSRHSAFSTGRRVANELI